MFKIGLFIFISMNYFILCSFVANQDNTAYNNILEKLKNNNVNYSENNNIDYQQYPLITHEQIYFVSSSNSDDIIIEKLKQLIQNINVTKKDLRMKSKKNNKNIVEIENNFKDIYVIVGDNTKNDEKMFIDKFLNDEIFIKFYPNITLNNEIKNLYIVRYK